MHLGSFPVRGLEDGVGQPAAESFVVAELLEELSVVLEDGHHHATECPVVFDPRVRRVVVPLCVPVGLVLGDLAGDLLCDELVDTV